MPLANNETVKAYLLKYFQIDEPKANELILRHSDKIRRGEDVGSFDYYVAETIAEEEGIPINEAMLEDEDEEETEEDEDDDDDEDSEEVIGDKDSEDEMDC